MSSNQNMWKMDKSLRLRADYYLIYVAYREHGNDGIKKMLFEIRTLHQERGYMNKLLQVAVKDVEEKLQDSKDGTSLETYKYSFTVLHLLSRLSKSC